MVSKVITFYSYKGGVGRSMAMANIAVLLAQWGKKTLIIDWDLEAPGLENFYSGYIDIEQVKKKNGLIDLLNLKITNPELKTETITWSDYISTIRIGKDTMLDMITAGKRDDSFISNVKKFDYNNFYQNADGGEYLEELREAWLNRYDFILIDSRTGLTDSSGICSIHMPDILVLLFTPNEQSFKGVKNVAEKAINGQKQIIFDRFKLRTLPVPSRIENQETALLDEWMTKIYNESGDMLEWLPKKGEGLNENLVTSAELLGLIKIPYKTFYAYGEKLAVVERGTSDPQDIGYSYETLAAVLAMDFQNIDLLIDSRDGYVKKAKGEDYSDDTEFRKKIEKEQEERKKLEDVLVIQEKKARRKTMVFRTIVATLVIGIIALIIILPYINKSKEIIPATYNDSLQQKEAYLSFKSTYFLSSDSAQLDFKSNLNLLKNYYLLGKPYQDSAKEILYALENAVSDTFKNSLKAYYTALQDKKGIVTNYFNNPVSAFGSITNTTPLFIQKTVDSIREVKYISNGILAQIAFSSDSSGMIAKYSENGNFLIDRKQEVKDMENLVTVLFSYDFKIKSFGYQPIKGIPVVDLAQKPVIEIFYCGSVKSKTGLTVKSKTSLTVKSKTSLIAAQIEKTLKATDKYRVFTNTNSRLVTETSTSKNEIKYNGNEEFIIARSIQGIVYKSTGIKLETSPARTATKNYLSIFICLDNPEQHSFKK
jgi:MinD-like ATPase involved in chromosome partitioning or flagellar assembly